MRRKTGAIEHVIEFGSRLPWTASVALAALLYVTFHLLARTAPVPPTNTALLGSFVVRQFLWAAAGILQYILPPALLFGVAVSLARRQRNGALLAGAAADPIRSINDLSWQDFERLVGASFERDGFAVEHSGGGADGGVDLVLTKGRETTLVQCKQWRAQKVGVTTVRELYGVMAARGAACGIVVSAGDFTTDARTFVSGRNISLVTGRALAAMLAEGDGAKAAKAPLDAPVCPRCGASMVERVARQGRSAGHVFWGCETFPRCRATLPSD